jgi:pyridoxamine---pyruvate transaminase
VRQPDFTLSAGPTMASPRVLAALSQPILFDYDPVFLERFKETERLLAQLSRTTNDVVLMQGEAVLGIEAAARALVKPGTRCLNLVSGVYAAWFGDWLREYGAEVHEVRVPYDEAIDPAIVSDALERHGPFGVVAVVHSETPSGIENPLAAIGPLAHEHGALMFADVVSALGGTQVEIDAWHVDLAVAGPQKCLGGPPGISLVTVSPAAWEAIESNPNAPRRSFLSLLDWKHRWIDGGRVAFPYTPSVSDVNGVHAALEEVLDEGPDAVIATHRQAARACRAGVRAMGLELWPKSESYAANCVTAVRLPAGVAVGELLTHVRKRYGVMLSGGYGELKENVIRLGHMGPASRSLYPLVAVSALGRGLIDLGVSVDLGAGAQATMESLAESPAGVLEGSTP